MSEPIYIQWMSVRHTDGRRPSGVGKNVSKWHLPKPGDETRALCGLPIQIPVNGKLIPKSICTVCLMKYEKTKTSDVY